MGRQIPTRMTQGINMNIIIYGTQYGSARTYAKELAKRTGFDVVEYTDVADINDYETIVYIGSLYAGGVQGMKKTFSKLADPTGKTIVIATVGLADPTVAEYTDHIKDGMRKQLPEDIFDAASIFHLRGAIDYSKLGLKHKTMMALLYRKCKSIPENEQTADVKALIETYNKQVDFIDFTTLDPIIEAVQ